VLFGATLGMVCAIAVARDEAALSRLDRWLLVLALLVLAAWGASSLQQSGGYSTDEAAFVQAAANLLVHGHDPYGANLTASLSEYAVPMHYWTYTMSGGFVNTLGYPALPVLLAVPFLKLTGGGQAVPIAELGALMVAMVAMFLLLPRGWRGLAVVICAAFPTLFGLAIAGDNAILTMAALIAVAYRWRSTGQAGALRRADWIRAAALGLALSTNQLSWFIAPFLILGIFLARRADLGIRDATRVCARFLGGAIAMFAVVNLPFIVWDPGAWVAGVAAPVTQHALPYGQGLIGLTLFLRIGGGAVDAYGYAAALLYLGLLVVFVVRNDRLANCCFVFPVIALFVSGRSLAEYWMVMVGVILVAVITAEQADGPRPLRWRLPSRRMAHVPGFTLVALVFVPTLACLGVALASPAPLTMHVLSARSDPSLRSVSRLRIAVHNGSDGSLQPHFSTDAKGQASPFWRIISGPVHLTAGSDAVYVLSASDATAMPGNGAPFTVQAVTGSPRTISSAQTYVQPGPAPENW